MTDPSTPLTSVWIAALIPYDGGKLVLVEEQPGKWVLPYGIVPFGANHSNVLVNAVKDKTNLDILPYNVLGVWFYNRPGGGVGGHSTIVYSAIYEDGELLSTDDTRAFTRAELKQMNHDDFLYDHFRILCDTGWI